MQFLCVDLMTNTRGGRKDVATRADPFTDIISRSKYSRQHVPFFHGITTELGDCLAEANLGQHFGKRDMIHYLLNEYFVGVELFSYLFPIRYPDSYDAAKPNAAPIRLVALLLLEIRWLGIEWKWQDNRVISDRHVNYFFLTASDHSQTKRLRYVLWPSSLKTKCSTRVKSETPQYLSFSPSRYLGTVITTCLWQYKSAVQSKCNRVFISELFVARTAVNAFTDRLILCFQNNSKDTAAMLSRYHILLFR